MVDSFGAGNNQDALDQNSFRATEITAAIQAGIKSSAVAMMEKYLGRRPPSERWPMMRAF